MSFLLDTNICSEHLRGSRRLTSRLIQYAGRLFIPAIVLGELYAWAYRRANPRSLLNLIDNELLHDVVVLPYDGDCARQFGQVRGELLRRGLPVSPIDLMIASVALVHELTLVTHNVSDSAHIPELTVTDWLAG